MRSTFACAISRLDAVDPTGGDLFEGDALTETADGITCLRPGSLQRGSICDMMPRHASVFVFLSRIDDLYSGPTASPAVIADQGVTNAASYSIALPNGGGLTPGASS